MGFWIRVAMTLVLALSSTVVSAQIAPGQRDAEAIAVIKAMDAYTASMKHFTVQVESYNDAAIGSSLVISNSSSTEVTVDRSGSLRSVTSDGLHTSQIYFNNGELVLYSNKHNAFSKADVPDDLGEALLFALSEFQVETPLLDLLLVNSLDHFVADIESIVYLGASRPIRGVDCHHLVISGPHLDLQIWVEEGDEPVPRKTVMTLKNDLGRPRHEVNMIWASTSQQRASTFEFDPPDGAVEVEFIEQL